MKSKRLIGLLLYTALPVWAFSQIKGTIVDIHQQPVEGATIVMQLPDSTYLEATISAADGTFASRKTICETFSKRFVRFSH